ncbi:hypothetical protein GO755_30370 [Spirosoma sp. HMF4905]|uniref:Uncharacterized protein n=1 Tax=Spirosoma arboris TaxID=2682092 RepID=A0A7K1SLC8_9BACT|nr:hypothetical protein [Spirosoma arboris]MVM34376.1 hypothetical protein [Spirosoma arboris]
MDAYKKFPQPDGTFRYWKYDGSALNCDESLDVFNALDYDQKVAQTTSTEPALADGFDHYQLRDCSGTGTTLGNFSLDPTDGVIEGGDPEPGQTNDSLN